MDEEWRDTKDYVFATFSDTKEPEGGKDHPRKDVTAVHTEMRVDLAGLMAAQGQEEVSYSQGVRARHRHLWPRGSNVQKVVQRIAVVPEYNAYGVVSHAHVSVSVKRRKVDSRKIMLAVMVSAFSGPGNEGTIRTTRERG